MPRYSPFLITTLLLLFRFHGEAKNPTIQDRSREAYSRIAKASDAEKIELLNEIVTFIIADSSQRALQLSAEAINLAQKIRKPSLEANSLMGLGRVLQYSGKVDSALNCFKRALHLKQTQHDLTKLEIPYFYVGFITHQRGQYKEALEEYKTALKYASLNTNHPIEGRCFTEMANCFRLLNETGKVAEYLDKAWNILQKGGDPYYLGNAYGHLGLVFNDLGMTEKATNCLVKSVRYAEVTGDSLSLGYQYSNLAGLFAMVSSKNKALEYNLKALRVFTNTSNKRGMGYSMTHLGNYYVQEENYSKALSYFKDAALLKEEVADWQGACFVYGNIAETYMKASQPSNALPFLRKADAMAGKSKDRLSETVVLNTYGNYFSAMKNHSQARYCFERSLWIAEELKLHDFITSNLSAISNEYQAEGKPAEALAFYKRYTAIKDSIVGSQDRRAQAELQLQYETEKKDRQLEQMSRLLMNSSVKSRSFLWGNLIIGMLLLAGTFIFVYRLNNRTRPAVNSISIYPEHSSSRKNAGTLLPDQASKSSLTDDMQQQIWTSLNNLMISEKLYLDSSIKLSSLAGRLNTNTSYLSKVINEQSKENFCNYLNQLRIREAQTLLSNPENQYLSIEGIAQTVGFNSKSAFNSAFKKYTSKTPSEYLSESQIAETSSVSD